MSNQTEKASKFERLKKYVVLALDYKFFELKEDKLDDINGVKPPWYAMFFNPRKMIKYFILFTVVIGVMVKMLGEIGQ